MWHKDNNGEDLRAMMSFINTTIEVQINLLLHSPEQAEPVNLNTPAAAFELCWTSNALRK